MGQRLEYHPIEDYGVIGNMRSIALVSITGSIDFFCYPRFDSPSLFAALLDPDKGGFFCIQADLRNSHTKQLYLPDTNILLTRFLSDDGIAEIADFMPVLEKNMTSQIIRRVHVVQGEIGFKLTCQPRFDYARMKHTAEQRSEHCIVFQPEGNHTPVALESSIPLLLENEDVVQSFRLKEGETAKFVFGESAVESVSLAVPDMLERKFHDTAQFWREWISKSNYTGRWREMVNRSALLLKLLIDQEYGSLIAAPTFGLPEKIGGSRNWDYRYTWLRDSSFTLYAMMRLGYIEETMHFQQWIHDRLNYGSSEGPLQVLYRLDGSPETPEIELDHLRGYMDSKPVRIGNAAYRQLQLDIYGELTDALYLANKYGDGSSHDDWENEKHILQWLAKNWNRDDEGIWEVRGGRRPFLHSRLMCWVAFDRAIRLGAKRSLDGPFDWMEETRLAISNDIFENFWDEELQAFVQYKGSKALDASVLLMSLLRFISPSDPKWISTLAAIERDLTVDTLVYRYRNNNCIDGIEGGEGAFTACSFWFIEALARSHQVDKARLLFEKMLGYANHLGLYSEEIGLNGAHLGNFPQALTHLALISAATYLDRELSGKPHAPWS
jgi:GH15 family glucan-1,4-alpha-glucosidase